MNRETKRIGPLTLEGKTPIGRGYKIFEWDWSARRWTACAENLG